MAYVQIEPLQVEANIVNQMYELIERYSVPSPPEDIVVFQVVTFTTFQTSMLVSILFLLLFPEFSVNSIWLTKLANHENLSARCELKSALVVVAPVDHDDDDESLTFSTVAAESTFGNVIIIIIIISTTMFMVVSSWQSHCESSPGSFDECRMVPSGRRPKTKPDD